MGCHMFSENYDQQPLDFHLQSVFFQRVFLQSVPSLRRKLRLLCGSALIFGFKNSVPHREPPGNL